MISNWIKLILQCFENQLFDIFRIKMSEINLKKTYLNKTCMFDFSSVAMS